MPQSAQSAVSNTAPQQLNQLSLLLLLTLHVRQLTHLLILLLLCLNQLNQPFLILLLSKSIRCLYYCSRASVSSVNCLYYSCCASVSSFSYRCYLWARVSKYTSRSGEFTERQSQTRQIKFVVRNTYKTSDVYAVSWCQRLRTCHRLRPGSITRHGTGTGLLS